MSTIQSFECTLPWINPSDTTLEGGAMAPGHRAVDSALVPHDVDRDSVANRLARGMLLGLLAISCSALASCATERASAQNGNDLPERLRTQVAPEPTTTWRAPDLRGYSSVLKPTDKVPIDPARPYDLL